ncbi:hypothetical protein [Streptomyces sp. TLI_171]|uniref:hypothetical protein n=1 Tax=Streptomyces sp. TLI_171 TaxID=1938859 RepID=UPI000C19AE54|nr:hypothetical protein [Streptomyces sp. TLI_171]RKE18251.1 hypothetical protein BX266_1535 [Streptomyces sp. TLI_171]
MYLTGRLSTALLGTVVAVLATYAAVHTIAVSWKGCDTHLEPGPRFALSVLLLPCLLLLLAAGALGGRLTSWTGVRARVDDPELARLLAVIGGIVVTAFALVLLLSAHPEPCPLY